RWRSPRPGPPGARWRAPSTPSSAADRDSSRSALLLVPGPPDRDGGLAVHRHQVTPVGGVHGGGGGLGGGAGLGQLVEERGHLRPQLVDGVLQLADPLHPGQVHALVLAQPLHLAQQRDAAGGLPPSPAGGPARAYQPEPVVPAQRLGVQPRQLGGHRDDEHRAVLVGARGKSARVHHTPALFITTVSITARPSQPVHHSPPITARPSGRTTWSPRRRSATPRSPARRDPSAPRPRR